ncbi:hypothetical protein M4I33_03925 [Clostridium sp. LY3-2]|nr:hypothetical protein [Clostridium sp. LY3-2]MCR6514025.1 hypothetical protein [Clostridium sp. LY3-2]
MDTNMNSFIIDYLIIDDKKYEYLDYEYIKKYKKITMNIVLRGNENEA